MMGRVQEAFAVTVAILLTITIMSALWPYLPETGPFSSVKDSLASAVQFIPLLIPTGALALLAKLRSM